MGKNTPTGEADLSPLQRRILRQLQAQAACIRAYGEIRARIILDVWGVPWPASVSGRRVLHLEAAE